MYTDPEEARSDLFLVGAVYLFGRILVGYMGGWLQDVAVVAEVFAVVSPLLVTAVAPVLLARYRDEPASAYGIPLRSRGLRNPQGGAALRSGIVLALPIVAATVVAALANPLTTASPLLALAAGAPLQFLRNVASWIGLVVLAVYATVKARDAFRSELKTLGEGITEVGRVLGIAGGVAALLLLVSVTGLNLTVLLLPLGVAGAVALLLRRERLNATTTRATLLAPVVLLALGPLNLFALFTNAAGFVQGVWAAAIVGGVGLLVAAMLEARGSAVSAAALAVCLAVFVPAFL